jgi:hypothetical protein
VKRKILIDVAVLFMGGLLTFGAEWFISGRQPFESRTTIVIKETSARRTAGSTAIIKEAAPTNADSQTPSSPAITPSARAPSATSSAATQVASTDLLEGPALASFTGHIANYERCGGAEAAPNSCQFSGVTIGATNFGAAWWTAGYDTSDGITFNLGGRFRRLTGTLGIVSVSGAGCEERMEVRGESRPLFGERLTGARSVDLDVAGVNVVTVSAEIVEQGAGDCQAGFGEPTGIT